MTLSKPNFALLAIGILNYAALTYYFINPIA